jgi:hypothetical protein
MSRAVVHADAVAGSLVAAALVRPERSAGMKVASVKKKLAGSEPSSCQLIKLGEDGGGHRPKPAAAPGQEDQRRPGVGLGRHSTRPSRSSRRIFSVIVARSGGSAGPARPCTARPVRTSAAPTHTTAERWVRS